ncbi:DUF349 domain-containing protein [Kushneria phosphatilytica]|uniref:DUF349 domain-containing protein n=1 Tax=Kushneria phosphatilytica TaxID=657387 RepID=A0A5C1A1N4_9GAMM|nr:DUF349 domain-containing protein [Kushneria phosphatilytica]QEL12056.1 DUF349 domain-containing protein [Kushneria phosphatilytica]
MSGFLQRLFAPRWRHPDPRVRRTAIDRLDPEQDHDTLRQLLDDADDNVRRAALDRLGDPRAWLESNDSLDDPEQRRRLVSLISGQQAAAPPLEERLPLIERLHDPDLLSELAYKGDNQQLRLAALARLQDEDRLVEQACHNGIAAVRRAAAARVESDTGLERLTRESRRDRHIARQARERLSERRNRLRERDERFQRRETLIEQLGQLARARWEPMYAARLRHLQREWASLAEDAEEDQRQRFHEFEQQASERIETEQARHRNQQAREQAEADAQAIVEALGETLERFAQQSTLTAQDIDWLRAQRQLHDERWRELTDRHSPEADLQQRFEHRQSRYSAILQAWQRYCEHADALEQALSEQDHLALTTLCGHIAWPDGLPQPASLQDAQRRLSQPSESASATADDTSSDHSATDGHYPGDERFVDDLEQLEHCLEQGDLNRATRLHDSLQQRQQRLDPAERSSHGARLRQLGARVLELRDWRNFAAAPKREQLCEAMETLAANELDERTRDQRHRRLVNEWKALGSAAATRELAQRFRSASDRVREQLSDFHAARDRLRQDNLAHRHTLCEQIETLLAQPDAISDPDELRAIRDRAREEWRQYAPVPREEGEELKRRFSKAMRTLQGVIDQQARAVGDAKRELVEQARTLEQSDMGAVERAEQTKALQRQWRELGRAPRGDEQALWKEFRRICDSIFAIRDEQRQQRRRQQDTRLDAMQALIERIDAWQPERAEERRVLDEALEEAQELTPLPSGNRANGMQKRWNGIVRDREARLETLELQSLHARWQQWTPLLQAHVAADDQQLAGQSPTPVEPPQTLRLSPQARQAHADRNTARHTVTAEHAEEWLAHLRVYLTVLAGAPIENADASRRLDVQVARLNDGMGSDLTLHDELDQLQCQLLANGPITSASWQHIAPQLDRLMEQLCWPESSDT